MASAMRASGERKPNAIRVMSRWGKQRWVVTEPEGFLILDAAALETLAGGSADRE